MNFFERLTSLFAWLQIMVSPSLVGVLIGFFLWMYLKGNAGIIAWGGTGGLGVALGVYWAEKVRRKGNTVEYMSRIRRHPELHDHDIGIK